MSVQLDHFFKLFKHGITVEKQEVKEAAVCCDMFTQTPDLFLFFRFEASRSLVSNVQYVGLEVWVKCSSCFHMTNVKLVWPSFEP